jgi:RNA polymerase sigma-70 factor (ECF subfamily)
VDETLDELFVRLNDGDELAIQAMFEALEPYMRMVVRRRMSGPLRAKFDSTDVVQSVWADLVDGLQQSKWKFENAAHFRAFVVKMTRNRFIDRLRKHRQSLDHEVSLPEDNLDAAVADQSPRVSENFYAGELWEQMVDACPEAHYELLKLKRQGASIDEIAERTKLHAGSVRRILYEIARRIARRRQQAAGSSSTPV